MYFHILTLFPEMISSGLNTSIIGRAQEAGLISVNIINIRDYTLEKHGHVDDAPYGGGAGMVMQCQPIYDAYIDVMGTLAAGKVNAFAKANGLTFEEALLDPAFQTMSFQKPKVIYTSPAGKVFHQQMAKAMVERRYGHGGCHQPHDPGCTDKRRFKRGRKFFQCASERGIYP